MCSKGGIGKKREFSDSYKRTSGLLLRPASSLFLFVSLASPSASLRFVDIISYCIINPSVCFFSLVFVAVC
jgi:hypothetical protein